MRQRSLDLQALRTLVTVIETGNMARAAEQLAYSPSAISMRLRRLEDDLGLVLISRGPRGVVATAEGERIVARARDILAAERALHAEAETSAVAGTVRIGLPVDLAWLLHGTWAVFAARYPQIRLEVQTHPSARWLNPPAGDRLADAPDLAVVTTAHDTTIGRPLGMAALAWVGSHTAPVPTSTSLPLALGPPGQCAFREQALNALDRSDRAYHIVYETEAFAGVATQVASGLAVSAIVPAMLTPELCILDPDHHGLPTLPDVAIRLHHSGPPLKPAAAALAEVIEQTMGDTRSLSPPRS